jgi:hypothetical protein
MVVANAYKNNFRYAPIISISITYHSKKGRAIWLGTVGYAAGLLLKSLRVDTPLPKGEGILLSTTHLALSGLHQKE